MLCRFIKKILQVIMEGFTAIVESIKIMMKPANEVSPAQKADAITKTFGYNSDYFFRNIF